MAWPSSREDKSTSVDAKAKVSAAGFIWSIKGQATDAAPMPAIAYVEIIKKSLLPSLLFFDLEFLGIYLTL
jgi:hypothetical protein